MEYLYGSLNKLVDLQKYKFISSDNTVNTSVDTKNQVDLSVNTQQLITLKAITKQDGVPGINYYRLFAYNSATDSFDLPLGDEIATGNGNFNLSTINSAWVQVGEYQKVEPALDEQGNPIFDIETGIQIMNPVYDEEGNPVMVPIYHKIDISISENGRLILNKIPVSALSDNLGFDEFGNVRYIESVIDGNSGGNVY